MECAPQHREQFAGHERGELANHAIGESDPLAVCAGKQQQAVAEIRVRGERTDDLGLLASHHIGGGPALGDPGHDRQSRARDGHESTRDLLGPRGQVDVWRLDPSLGTPDHSRRNDRDGAERPLPVGGDPVECTSEVPFGQLGESPTARRAGRGFCRPHRAGTRAARTSPSPAPRAPRRGSMKE